jgi:glutathione S-transferase
LAYTETEYTEKTYDLDASAPEKSNWFAEKFTLGMPFPNLPYYIDGILFSIQFNFLFYDFLSLLGDITLTESNAVARYIARKNGLDGQTEQEKLTIDMFENLTYNFHIDLGRVCYGPEFVITELLFYTYLEAKV